MLRLFGTSVPGAGKLLVLEVANDERDGRANDDVVFGTGRTPLPVTPGELGSV
jgi:hypothetical protein